MELILASASPRRRELLAEAGYRCRVVPPSAEAEDTPAQGETPEALVARLARQKAADVAGRLTEPAIVVACDTVVQCDGEILGKPDDEAHARRMLTRLSGRTHEVLSGLCVFRVPGKQGPRVEVVRSTLRMDVLTAEQIDEYLASGLWRGKAGAFGLQDRLGWVRIENGSVSNVVGLPMERLEELLSAEGIRPEPSAEG